MKANMLSCSGKRGRKEFNLRTWRKYSIKIISHAILEEPKTWLSPTHFSFTTAGRRVSTIQSCGYFLSNLIFLSPMIKTRVDRNIDS